MARQNVDTRSDHNLAVYIHWPYCTRICPYCDFNVYKAKGEAHTALIDCICADLAYWRDWSGPRQISSVHFGGGTPSLLRPEDISEILNQIKTLWRLNADCEIALEANPNDTDELRWLAYRQAGINRLSVGVQSFHSPALNLLGRDHSPAQARAAISLAADIFPLVSADLIYGWAGQTSDLLAQDLDVLLSLDIGHISAYQLTIEDGTAFGRAAQRGDMKAVDDEASADFYEQVQATLGSHGFEHYEVSNFAKTNQRSAHNLAYWQGKDYVGIGPGAHGRLSVDGKKFATITALNPKAYCAHVRAHGHGMDVRQVLSAQERGEEYVLMGLRIEDGISLQRYEQITGRMLGGPNLQGFLADGLLIRSGDLLFASPDGRLVLNRITERLLLDCYSS